MKAWILFLILAIGVQPLQAVSSCDMEPEQAPMHAVDGDGGNNHDCCDPDPADTQAGCDHALQCGFCNVLVSNLSVVPIVAIGWDRSYARVLGSGQLTPCHSSPPFRPPAV